MESLRNKRRLLPLLALPIILLAVIVGFLQTRTQLPQHALADPVPYEISFTEEKNVLGTSVGTSSTSIYTELGNPVDANFTNVETASGAWQIIHAGGLIFIRPIRHLLSIMINFTGQPTAMVVAGWVDDSPSHLSYLTSGNSFDFFGDEPDYFGVMNQSGDDLVIISMTVSYACGEASPSPYANDEGLEYLRYDGYPYGLLITGYTGSAATLVIPSAVNGVDVGVITEELFMDHYELMSVTIPNGVLSIGVRAFKDSGLTGTILIPLSVEGMGSNAFDNCHNLTEIRVEAAYDDIVWNELGWAADWSPDEINVIYGYSS